MQYKQVKPLVWEKQELGAEIYQAKTFFGDLVCGVDNDGLAWGSGVDMSAGWTEYSDLEDAMKTIEYHHRSRVIDHINSFFT